MAEPDARPFTVQRRPAGFGLTPALAVLAWMAAFSFTLLAPWLLGLRFRDQWLPLLAIALLVVVSRYRLFLLQWRHLNPAMVAVLVWALMSAAWSAVPGFVVTQAVVMIGVSVIGLAFSLAGWFPDRFALRLGLVTALMMGASVVTALLFPDIGIHSGTDVSLLNSWRGVTYQKNALGQLCAVALIVWSYLWAARKVSTPVAVLGLGLSLFTLLQSRSSTSLMLAVLCSGAVVALLRPTLEIGPVLRRLITAGIVILIPSLTYLAVATPYLGFIGDFFGKDMTFSGRVQIWDALMDEIALHPWLGTGLSSFWGGMNPGELRVQTAVQWQVRDSHNGYLTLVNELGLIGFAMFLVFLGWHCAALARLARISRTQYALHAPLFAYLVLANTSESGWFFPVSVTHLLGMFVSIEVSRLLLEARWRERRAERERASSRALVPVPRR